LQRSCARRIATCIDAIAVAAGIAYAADCRADAYSDTAVMSRCDAVGRRARAADTDAC